MTPVDTVGLRRRCTLCKHRPRVLVGGLSSTAQVEGITTDGVDVWLVDAKQDKVFRYAGAASRLSGTQSAASNFSLNSANSNPKDLVTDGTSIWVVNDSTTDKVFKYTKAGALVGSWTISTPGVSSPTGITLNPAAPSELWIVDNGTDKIYQYDAAVGLKSGSKAASKVFALAVGNTNPQGIADPPASTGVALDADVSYASDSTNDVRGDMLAAPLVDLRQTSAASLTQRHEDAWLSSPSKRTDLAIDSLNQIASAAKAGRSASAFGIDRMRTQVDATSHDEAVLELADELNLSVRVPALR